MQDGTYAAWMQSGFEIPQTQVWYPISLNPLGGNVGIGTINPQHLLHVAGVIGAEAIIVSATGADYVFDDDYDLKPLDEVSKYIDRNHHLPGIPSAAEVAEKGVSLGDMQSKLLAKIEELTLHMIQAERENQELRDRVARLEHGAAGGVPDNSGKTR